MNPNNSEIVVNIWFIVNIETGFSCEWKIKPYCLQGSDDEKLRILKLLAETDFYTAERFAIPKNYKLVHGAKSLEGFIHLSNINDEMEKNFDYYISTIEERMPRQVLFPYDENKRKLIKLKFDENPLYVKTILMENLNGELKPYTTKENIEWYNKEREKQNGLGI